jgi:hypothetical protein
MLIPEAIYASRPSVNTLVDISLCKLKMPFALKQISPINIEVLINFNAELRKE